jgi:two-component system response regulator FixJ
MNTKHDQVGTVFVIDDDSAITESLSDLAQFLNLSVETFSSAFEFLEYLQSNTIPKTTCLVADVRMPRMSGIDLQQRLIEKGQQYPMIIVTGHGNEEIKQKAEDLGVFAYFEKPYLTQDIANTMLEAISQAG